MEKNGRKTRPARRRMRGMPSVCGVYKIGKGPSSSHTMGPEKIASVFLARHPEADAFQVTLYGSLAETGIGHGTDRVIRETFGVLPCDIRFDTGKHSLPHPNTMDLVAWREGVETGRARAMSVGGGRICFEGEAEEQERLVYPLDTFEQIAGYCKERGLRLWQYAEEVEGESLRPYIRRAWETMCDCIVRGLSAEGVLPGGLQVVRKAKLLHDQGSKAEAPETRQTRIVCSYAYAVSEENACAHTVVTAPTCGAAGVLPAVLYDARTRGLATDEDICRALETAGLIGNLIRTNASISGAECGCQAEIGSACAMAAAALAELRGLRNEEIECAAEIAIEHHLGLTCDPVCGLVQIPCIERNAVAAMRAISAATLAGFLTDTRKISLDKVIQTMYETGRDLSYRYRETSKAGLAKLKIAPD